MDTVAVQSRPLKLVAEPLAHMLGVAENHHPFKALAADKPQGGFCLLQRADGKTELVNIRTILLLGLYGDFHLVSLIHPGHRHHLLGDGGGKESQISTVFHFLNNPGHILEKAHIQHPVCLVQHHSLNFVQADIFSIVVIHQPPGGGYHDLGLLLQLLRLCSQTRAAIEHRHPDTLIIGEQSPQLIADLERQFPGRRQNQPLHIAACRVDMLNHGNTKRECLSRAGGRFGDHILPLQKRRNGLLLDRGRITVAFLLQSPQHGLAQAQVRKRNIAFFHISFVLIPYYLFVF